MTLYILSVIVSFFAILFFAKGALNTHVTIGGLILAMICSLVPLVNCCFGIVMFLAYLTESENLFLNKKLF